ncbi:MAG: hypothetical protein RML72_02585, partial [Bacteroidia bacterium]|nr:hypothetical protein [Bacteroidia bacterium]
MDPLLGANSWEYAFTALPYFRSPGSQAVIWSILKIKVDSNDKKFITSEVYIHYTVIDTLYKTQFNKRGLVVWESFLPYTSSEFNFQPNNARGEKVYWIEKSFEVLPGRVYVVSVSLRINNEEVYTKEVSMNFPPLKGDAHFSGILFFYQPPTLPPLSLESCLVDFSIPLTSSRIYGVFQLRRLKKKAYTLTKVVFRK